MSYYFSVFDSKNGYLKLVGAFEGHLDMCYWKLKNSNKLIAVYQEGCGPVCYVERFDFYIYDGKTLAKADFDSVIPSVTGKDFFGTNYEKNTEKMKKDDVVCTMLFELPRSGKNIVVKFGN